MKRMFAGLLLATSLAQAANLSDLRPYEFEVLFTNPVCAEYRYPTPVLANDGTTLEAKPRNVYCKSSDLAASASRSISPQFRLIEWTNDPATKEIFMAFLSFSNEDVGRALCAAVRRGVKLGIVLDAEPDEEAEGNRLAEGLKQCGPGVQVYYRGNRGGIGYAHNKLFLVNPSDARQVRVVFSSGNMTTGTALHHENWNFVTTSPRSHFAQAQLCLRDSLINHAETKAAFVAAMASCRAAIATPEEDDIKSFFVPGEGRKAFNAIKSMAEAAERVDVTAHRFSGDFVRLFDALLTGGKNIRMVTDDDMYWTWKLRRDIGRNMRTEAYKVMDLRAKGLDLRFLETNQNNVILQHNKYMIFELGARDAVFAGAGNFTSSAFSNNMENFYVMTAPEVVRAYQAQYEKFYGEMATAESRMPRDYVMP